MLHITPGERLLLQQHVHFGLVGEKYGQVCGQDAVFDQAQCLFVFVAVEFTENIVAFLRNKE
jgi:hypothetical protein